MNISDITATLNLDPKISTLQTAGEKIRPLPTSAELMVILIEKSLEQTPDKEVETGKSSKVDIII